MGNTFNRAKFNTGSSITRYLCEYSMSQTFQANCDPRMMISSGYIFNQSISADAALGWGYDVAYSMTEEFSADTVLQVAWALKYAVSQSFEAEAAMALRLFPSIAFEQSFDTTVQLKITVCYRITAAQSFSAAATMTILITPLYSVSYQVFQAEISAVPTAAHEAVLDITIPAGGTLVIDTDNYTAYLDNVSVIDKMSGEWVKIRRPLRRMTVAGGTSGDLAVKLLYRELYL